MAPKDETTDHAPALSRRSMLTGAGVAVTGGVAIATLGSAGTAEANIPSGTVSTGARGSTVTEFRGRIEQTGSTGESFSSVGFVYATQGADPTDLFAGPTHDVTTALLTCSATGELVARVLDQSVHALDIAGTMSVYQRTSPGADWTDPSSFVVGTEVARFALTMQDVLAVFAPGQGLPTLSGDMRQTLARHLGGALAGKTFGVKGQRLRLSANGLGQLVDPVTLNARLEIAGSWTAE